MQVAQTIRSHGYCVCHLERPSQTVVYFGDCRGVPHGSCQADVVASPLSPLFSTGMENVGAMSRVSNALIESTNTKLRVLHRMAFGFAQPEHLIALALLDRGGYCPPLPGRQVALSTHGLVRRALNFAQGHSGGRRAERSREQLDGCANKY